MSKTGGPDMKSKEPLKKPLGKGLNNPISSKRGTSDGSLVKRKEPNIMANMGGLYAQLAKRFTSAMVRSDCK